jgi:hypothetical protein
LLDKINKAVPRNVEAKWLKKLVYTFNRIFSFRPCRRQEKIDQLCSALASLEMLWRYSQPYHPPIGLEMPTPVPA